MPSLAPLNLAADLWSIVRPRTSSLNVLEAIHAAAGNLRKLGDAALKSAADALRRRARSGVDITRDEILVPAFALVLESTRRVHGIALFDTQLLAGMAMARGAIAEMATGEGKTLAAALPAMLFSLRGLGVHVATPNAYLAQRDFERVGPILQLLGASVGLVPEAERTPLAPQAHIPLAEREEYVNAKRAAYACDVTYATGYELGFDYLRDQLQVCARRVPAWESGNLNCCAARLSRQPLPVQPRTELRNHRRDRLGADRRGLPAAGLERRQPIGRSPGGLPGSPTGRRVAALKTTTS